MARLPCYNLSDMNREQIGRRIAAARHEAGLTQAQLAEAVGRSKNTVPNWEGGQNEPSRAVMERIAEVTNKPIGYFYGQEEAELVQEVRELQRRLETLDVISRDATVRQTSVVRLPDLLGGGGIDVPRMILPEGLPEERLAVAYADAHAPEGIRDEDLLIVDTRVEDLSSGSLVVAAVSSQLVVRRMFQIGDEVLLVGEGTHDQVERSAIKGRVVRSMTIREHGPR